MAPRGIDAYTSSSLPSPRALKCLATNRLRMSTAQSRPLSTSTLRVLIGPLPVIIRHSSMVATSHAPIRPRMRPPRCGPRPRPEGRDLHGPRAPPRPGTRPFLPTHPPKFSCPIPRCPSSLLFAARFSSRSSSSTSCARFFRSFASWSQSMLSRPRFIDSVVFLIFMCIPHFWAREGSPPLCCRTSDESLRICIRKAFDFEGPPKTRKPA